MKRREERQRDEESARDQADQRQEELLAKLKSREEAARTPPASPEPEPDDPSEAPAD